MLANFTTCALVAVSTMAVNLEGFYGGGFGSYDNDVPAFDGGFGYGDDIFGDHFGGNSFSHYDSTPYQNHYPGGFK